MVSRLARLARVDAVGVTDTRLNRTFFAGVDAVVRGSRLAEEAGCLQHGTTTILLHSIAVAYWCERVARRYGLTSHLDELRRAALLHDYFLYNWHEPDPEHFGHALVHGARACANARRDFPDLTAREANAITNHMFPLAVLPPRYREGWLVTCGDKVCASYETVMRSAPAYPVLRALCAHYLPGLALAAPATDDGRGTSARPSLAGGL